MATNNGKDAVAESVEEAGIVDQQSAAAPAEDSFTSEAFTTGAQSGMASSDADSETPAPAARSGMRGIPANLLGQAGDKARDYATQGKDAATERLGDFAGLVTSLADSLGDRLGPQTGDYARRAADSVSQFAEGLKAKDVDDLVDDTRRIIKQSPAMAIGAAAALGFVLVRLAKAGSDDGNTTKPEPDEV